MRTIKSIQSEISDLKRELVKCRQRLDTKKAKKIDDRLIFLDECILYLKTEPRQEYIKLEIKHLECQISEIEKDINMFLGRKEFEKITKSAFCKLKKAKEKAFDLPKLRKYLENLKFIEGKGVQP